MSSKGTPNTGITGCTTPTNFRATRSNSKVATQQTSVSPQAATLEKKKAKAKDLESEAHKLLIGEECLSDGAIITHHTIMHTLSLIIQKYSAAAPQNLTRALTALVALLHQTNNSSNTATQFEPVMNTLTQKLGDHIEKTMQDKFEKMSTFIKGSLADQCKALSPPEGLAETVTTLKKQSNNSNIPNQRHGTQL
ncbi:hypothetical protein V8E53_003125 [Lactarius tabidus]